MSNQYNAHLETVHNDDGEVIAVHLHHYDDWHGHDVHAKTPDGGKTWYLMYFVPGQVIAPEGAIDVEFDGEDTVYYMLIPFVDLIMRLVDRE